MTERRSPHRLRSRLAWTFILVVAVSTGLVAGTTVFLATDARMRNFRTNALDEARFTAVIGPSQLDEESFERLRLGYESRTDATLVAVTDTAVFASARDLTVDDIPPVLTEPAADESDGPAVRGVAATVDGRPTYVVVSTTSGGDRYYSFFSMEQLADSRRELVRFALAVWAVVLVVAGAIAWWVSRRALRPVAEIASTAEAIAGGDLGARLPDSVGDELGALSASFNHMADEVERVIDRLERAAERERRFTADVAHELRTPLTGMSAAASLLGDQLDELPPRLRRPAGIIVSDISRLRDLVVELLELARLDAGNERPSLEDLRVADAVASVVRSLPGSDAVRMGVPPSVSVLADPTRLRRVLTNVLANAISHGAGEVVVRADGPRPSGTVDIVVIDHGPGLVPGDEERVFDRFYKSEVSRAAGGSGLGLAISRQHARSMGGDVVAGNEPGAGARFTITLPAAGERFVTNSQPS